MTGIERDRLAVLETDRGRPTLLHIDTLYARADTDLAAMGRKLCGERARYVVHAAFDHADANVLHSCGEQPSEIGAERIVRAQRAMQAAGSEEIAHLWRLEGLVHPGTRALNWKR